MKKVVVSLEHRFYECNGAIYTKLAFPYLYWSDYLKFFDEVAVVARVGNVQSVDSSFSRVDGPQVSVIKMPYYVGVKSFFTKIPSLLWSAYKIVKSKEFYILRTGNVSNILWLFIFLFRKPYLREFPGNIKEGIIGYGGTTLAVRLVANFLDHFSSFQARYSNANSFVSNDCKRLYESNMPSYVFSSFNLNEVTARKTNFSCEGIFNLVSVGRLEGEKGHKDLIQSLTKVGVKTKLTVIGDGTQRESLEVLAQELNVNIEFLGSILDRDKLFSIIKDSDLYIIPSHTEGMPRSLLEAMSVGTPCIGTRVGGIPEVIDGQYLVSAKDTQEMANLIDVIADNEQLRETMSSDNLIFVRNNYSKAVMDKKKINFWKELYK